MSSIDPQIFLNVVDEIEFIEKFYSEQVFLLIDKEFSVFDDRVDALRADMLDYLMSQNEDNCDEIARMESLDWGMQNVDPLLLIESVMLDAALTSLFNFLEIKMKSFFAKYYYQAPFAYVDDHGKRLEREAFLRKVERFKFEELLENFIGMFGLKLSDEIEKNLKEFNLLVNSIKHGDGNSFRKLKDEFPNRVKGEFDIFPKSQFLVRRRDDVTIFSVILKNLFRSFSQNQLRG